MFKGTHFFNGMWKLNQM